MNTQRMKRLGIVLTACLALFSTSTTQVQPVVAMQAGAGDHGPARSLTMTPTLTWNTFLGTVNDDYGQSVAVDGSGNVYVTGHSSASWGVPVNPHAGGTDAFAAKLNSSGYLRWVTFLGSAGQDSGRAIIVAGGSVYVTGDSAATWGSPINEHAGGNDAFVARLSASDGTLVWNTFLGSPGDDHGRAIAVDGSGNPHVAGDSHATWGAPVNAFAGSQDTFAAELDSGGVRQWHTFMGSASTDYGYGIATDAAANVYVGGCSNTTWGAPVHAYAGGWEGFGAKLDSAGARQWNTFVGSSNHDYVYAIAADGPGNVYLAGHSLATWGDPTDPFAGGADAFGVKLTTAGVPQRLAFMGSAGNDYGKGVAVDSSGNVYISGYSDGTWGTPVNAFAGGLEGFAAKFDNSGARQWNTFMGSASTDYGRAIAVSGSNVYVAGESDAMWGTPYEGHHGGWDAYAARFDGTGARQMSSFLGSGHDYGEGIAIDSAGNIYVAGESYASWGTPINAHAGGRDAFVAKLSRSGALLWNTFLGSTDTDLARDIAVDASGNVYVIGESGAPWGAPVNAHAGGRDAFIAKLSSSGSLLWNTFLGSSENEGGNAIAVDGPGNVYGAGDSDATFGTPVDEFAGYQDVFVAKLSSSGARQWNTFLGSATYDWGEGISVDSSGNIYLTGESDATWGAPVNAHAGGEDGFVAKLNGGGARSWHTFLGSSDGDSGVGIGVDGAGNIYVAGTSDGTWGAPLNPHAGVEDGFIAQLNGNGVRQWNTFLGSPVEDGLEALDVNAGGNVYVVGFSAQSWGTPVSPYHGDDDAFVAQVSRGGAIEWHTFIGSEADDLAESVAVQGNTVYVVGESRKSWGTPVNAHAGGRDVFVAGVQVPSGINLPLIFR